MNDLYNVLTRFGDCYKLNAHMDWNPNLLSNYEWIQYNPRKNIDRDALSITSLDGGMSGKPDLDSLYEYYNQTGIALYEKDFNKKTIIYDYFKTWLDPVAAHLGRTHIIRLNNGGYFPPHRDNKHFDIESFRLFIPLTYDTSTNFFMLEDNKLEFERGYMYFIDTAKMHTVFNASDIPWYFVVVNLVLTEESIKDTLKLITG